MSAELAARAGAPRGAHPRRRRRSLQRQLAGRSSGRSSSRSSACRRASRPRPASRTDADVLEELAPLHELPRLVLQYRQLAKLKSTYVDALPGARPPRDRAACTPSSTRRWRPPGGSPRATRTCRTSRCRTRAGPRDPRKAFVARAGLAAGRRRLLADRAAHHGPPVGRPGAHRGVPAAARTCTRARRSRSSACRRARVRPGAAGRAPRSSTSASCTAWARAALSRAARHAAGARPQAFIRDYFRVLRRGAGLPRPHAGRGARARLRDHAPRPAPLPAAAWRARSPAGARRRRAGRHQHPASRARPPTSSRWRWCASHEGLAAPRRWRPALLLQVHDELLLECPPEEASAVGERVRRRDGRRGRSWRCRSRSSVGAGERWFDVH